MLTSALHSVIFFYKLSNAEVLITFGILFFVSAGFSERPLWSVLHLARSGCNDFQLRHSINFYMTAIRFYTVFPSVFFLYSLNLRSRSTNIWDPVFFEQLYKITGTTLSVVLKHLFQFER